MSFNIDEVEFNFDFIGDAVESLDHSTIKNIMKSYYSSELSATKIINEFSLDTTPAKLYKNFPCVEMEKRCPYDNFHLVVKMPSKSDFNLFLRGHGNTLFCPKCGHEDCKLCNCENCKLNRENEIKEKQQAIEEEYDIEAHGLIQENKLSLRDKLYLAALIRGYMDETQKYITPLGEKKLKLAPTEAFSVEIINHLHDQGLICPSPQSEISAFVEGKKFPKEFFLYEVEYQLLIDPEDCKQNMINRLMYPDRTPFLDDRQETYRLWKEIAEAEAEEFLLYRMNAVGLNFKIGSKTKMVLNQLLEYFSVGQINSFTYRAVANSLQWYMENGNITKTHAANSVVSRLEKSGERALSEGWKVNSWGRNFDLDQSEISSVLYNAIMQLSECGFTEIPTTNF